MTATKPRRHITNDDVRRSYAFMDLLKVCHGAADLVKENIKPDGVACSIPGAIELAMDKWAELHDAMEGAQCDDDEPVEGAVRAEPVKPAAPARSAEGTVYHLCHQWDVVKANLDLDLLQSTGDDKDHDRILDDARAQFRAIERAILATKPDTIRDVDLVSMLRLARKVIGDDQFTTEQEERCQQMLQLVDTTLAMRAHPSDWNHEVQS